MAASKRTAASYVAESRNTKKKNPFTGKTLAEMKKMYSKMTPAQRAANVETFRAAAKNAPKAKKAPVPKGGSNAKPAATKPQATKPRQTTPAEAKARFFQSSRGGAPKRSDFPAGRGGQAKYAAAKRRYEKGNAPTRPGTAAGRANIRRMVEEQSGSGRRNQQQVEARRRRARQQAAARNRRQYLASKNNDM